jgi:hypothetical protein
VPDTLDPVGMVNLEGSPWFFLYQEPHLENECLRQMKEEEYPRTMDMLNFIGIVSTF